MWRLIRVCRRGVGIGVVALGRGAIAADRGDFLESRVNGGIVAADRIDFLEGRVNGEVVVTGRIDFLESRVVDGWEVWCGWNEIFRYFNGLCFDR